MEEEKMQSSSEAENPAASPVGAHMPFLKGLAGLKAVMLLLLFWWHLPFTYKPPVDLGARTCELLFVCSGFLMGYNYCLKDVPATWAESFRWVARKFIIFWPLHAVCILLILFRNVLLGIAPDVKVESIFIAVILSLTFLHAWGTVPFTSTVERGITAGVSPFILNGASWFLSALMFCYFIAPQFLRILKNRVLSLGLFLLAFFSRYSLEYISRTYPGQFWHLQLHTSPILRCLEFLMGMFLASLFLSLKESLSIGELHSNASMRLFIFSALEIVVTASVICLTVVQNGHWYRGMFAFLFCVWTFALAFNEGIVSKILSLPPFQWLSKIQFEFFVLHQTLYVLLANRLSPLINNRNAMSMVLFVITIVCSILTHFFTKQLRKVARTI